MMIASVSPRFCGTFKLEIGHDPSADLSDSPGLPINRKTLNIDYGGRRPGYVKTVEALAKAVKTRLPENVLVTLAIGPWGGNSAYDTVAIRVLTPDREKVLGERRFFRSINDYDAPDPGMLVPKILRDNLFSARVFNRARQLLKQVQKNPNPAPVAPVSGDVPDYTGLW